MKLLSCLPLLVASLFLTSCDDDYKGVLSVTQKITLKMKGDGQMIIPPGDHGAKIIAGKSSVKLTMKVKNKEYQVEFKIPKNVKVRSFNDVNLTPQASGQAYHLKGAEQSYSQNSENVNTTESCTYYTTTNECGYYTTPEECSTDSDGVETCTGGDSVWECRDVTVGHDGSRYVEYYLTYRQTDRQVHVLDPATMAEIGIFRNTTKATDKHYISQGSCD